MRTEIALAAMRALVFAVLAVAVNHPVHAQQGASDAAPPGIEEPVFKPAIDGVFEAFETHSLVGLGDRHGLTQSAAFYEDVVRDARFARDVGNVVVEFGGAAHQDVIDRYVNGESVPYPELRRVWTDTVGWVPTVTRIYFPHFFAAVRAVNVTLPPERRIRVWLGEPPIDWSEIRTSDQLQEIGARRDRHAADIISRDILANNRKALVVYGSGHFELLDAEERALFVAWADAAPESAATFGGNLHQRVETEHPGTFFVVQVYVGFTDEPCTRRFEERFEQWKLPALAVPVLGTTLERDLRECLPPIEVDAARSFPTAWPKGVQDYRRAHPDDHVLFEGDAILFYGPAARLTRSPILPDLVLDTEYREEISRRMEVFTGEPLAPDFGLTIPLYLPFTNRDP